MINMLIDDDGDKDWKGLSVCILHTMYVYCKVYIAYMSNSSGNRSLAENEDSEIVTVVGVRSENQKASHLL